MFMYRHSTHSPFLILFYFYFDNNEMEPKDNIKARATVPQKLFGMAPQSFLKTATKKYLPYLNQSDADDKTIKTVT